MTNETFEGSCTCGEVRFRMSSKPMFVHCCHCTWCQRESGTAFALNALIETSRLQLLHGAPQLVDTPSNSGKGQQVARCPLCHVALWSHYAGAGPAFAFVRVGTLQSPHLLPPDIHIFTSTRLPWVNLDPVVPAMNEYYDRNLHWPRESLARREAAISSSLPSG